MDTAFFTSAGDGGQTNSLGHPWSGQSPSSGFGSQTGRTQARPVAMATATKKSYVKKPLNPFMLYLKEQRAQGIVEGSSKDLQLLGKKWTQLSRAERAKYFEMARKEKLEHKIKHPDYSLGENLKKRKEEVLLGAARRKCRERFGPTGRDLWCGSCQKSKKCTQFTG